MLGNFVLLMTPWVPGPFIFGEQRQYFRKYILLAQVHLMKLLCIKQLIIYINNIKIIIIN